MGNIITDNNEPINKLENIIIEQTNIIQKLNILIENNNKEKEDLKIEIENLKKYLKEDTNNRLIHVNKINNKIFHKNLDKFVDKWYSENEKEIDIGVIGTYPIIGEIDILPDKIEKYIYKKALHITFSALKELNMNVMGAEVSLNLKPYNNTDIINDKQN